MASAGSDRIQRLWDRLCDAQSWNFVTHGLKNGDLFFVLSLMRAFRRIRANGAPIRFIADTDGKLRLLRLFQPELDFIGVSPELSAAGNDEIADWCRATGRDGFAPGSLIRLHPFSFANRQYRISSVLGNLDAFHLVELFKTALDLPLCLSPGEPKIRDELKQEALRLIQQYALPLGRTLIIFPHAQTLPFDGMPVLSEVAALASGRGLTVCSAVHGAEAPVPGTRPIRISFDTIIPFCELAGYVVALRSGIGDILSSARLRKAYLYMNEGHVTHESPNAYGMCDCNYDVAFAGDAHAKTVADGIIAALDEPPFTTPRRFVPDAILRFFNVMPEGAGEIAFTSETGCRLGRYTVFRDAVLAEGWCGLEGWGVWNMGFRAVCYLRPPAALRSGPAGPLFLELHLEVAVAASLPQLDLEIHLNERRETVRATEPQITVVFELSEKERQIECHRLIFTVDNPRSARDLSAGRNPDDRVVGIALKKVRYVRVRP